MGMEDEVGRLATMVADKSRKEGIEEVPTKIPDPPQGGEVMEEPKLANKGRSGMLVLWQERPQGKRVLEKARRFGENQMRIRAD